MLTSPLTSDLDEILSQVPELWKQLKGASIFLTGGTGFFGVWLLESLLHANRKFGLEIKVTVLTRNKVRFLTSNPHMARAPELTFHFGDVRSFDFPPGRFTHVVHAGADVSEKLNREQPQLMSDVIIQGTRRTLDFAAQCGTKKFLFVSSGAVYGRQRPHTTHMGETDPLLLAPLEQSSAYAAGKREAERLCLEASKSGMEIPIARGFAFVGPHLPQNMHFAIGNFIRDALRHEPIVVQGDGTTFRSYLYASDLVVWLWTILLEGKSGRAYNVGSERRVTMMELAQLISKEIAPDVQVRIMQTPRPGQSVEQYVPSTARAREELGLVETVDLKQAIRRTARLSC